MGLPLAEIAKERAQKEAAAAENPPRPNTPPLAREKGGSQLRDCEFQGDGPRDAFFQMVREMEGRMRRVVPDSDAHYPHLGQEIIVTARHAFAAACEQAQINALPLPLEMKGLGRTQQGHVRLDHYCLGSKAAMALAQSMPYSQGLIISFSAAGNAIDDEVGAELIKALAEREGTVVAIDLSHNRLGDRSTEYKHQPEGGSIAAEDRGRLSLQALTGMLLNPRHGVRVLRLGGNQLGDQFCRAVGDVLAADQTIAVLDLSDNGLTARGRDLREGSDTGDACSEQGATEEGAAPTPGGGIAGVAEGGGGAECLADTIEVSTARHCHVSLRDSARPQP